MIKQLFLAAALAASHLACGAAPFFHGPPSVTVLTYHRISPDTTAPSGEDVQTTRFEEHLKMMKSRGVHSLTASELTALMARGGAMPSNSVVLTFDDGWKSHVLAQQLLAKYNLKGTFYIVSGMVDTPGYITSDELRYLAAQPNVEIGTHTHTHFVWTNSLESIDTKVIVDEMRQSKQIIERIIGKPVRTFAWPYGYVRPDAQQAAKAMGYTSLGEINRKSINDADVSPMQMQRLNVEGVCSAAQVQGMIDTGLLNKCK